MNCLLRVTEFDEGFQPCAFDDRLEAYSLTPDESVELPELDGKQRRA